MILVLGQQGGDSVNLYNETNQLCRNFIKKTMIIMEING